MAQRLGLHKDPTHFPLSPWVCEIRRRGWNHLCVLNAIALTSYGAESCLPATSDSRPPQNADDSDWHASRFAKPSSVPANIGGIKDMSFALAHRELADMSRDLSVIYCKNVDQKEKLVVQVEEGLTEKYLASMDSNEPSHTIVAALIQVKLASVRLITQYRVYRDSKSELDRQKAFMSALELLEACEYHSTQYAPLNWEWVFQTTIPWLALAIVITALPHVSNSLDRERAKHSIEHNFNLFSPSSAPVSCSPMWKMLVQLHRRMEEGQGSVYNASPTGIHRSEPSSSVSLGSGDQSAGLMDELMLDFNQIGASQDPYFHSNQSAMRDGEFPWLHGQVPLTEEQFQWPPP